MSDETGPDRRATDQDVGEHKDARIRNFQKY
jgi:hypothetical protein